MSQNVNTLPVMLTQASRTCPDVPQPQLYASPPATTASVCLEPQDTCNTRIPAKMGHGVGIEVDASTPAKLARGLVFDLLGEPKPGSGRTFACRVLIQVAGEGGGGGVGESGHKGDEGLRKA